MYDLWLPPGIKELNITRKLCSFFMTLKISDNPWFSEAFRGYGKGTLTGQWLIDSNSFYMDLKKIAPSFLSIKILYDNLG